MAAVSEKQCEDCVFLLNDLSTAHVSHLQLEHLHYQYLKINLQKHQERRKHSLKAKKWEVPAGLHPDTKLCLWETQTVGLDNISLISQ